MLCELVLHGLSFGKNLMHLKNCEKTGKLEISGKVLEITGEP